MALCSICSNAKAREVNVRLLRGARVKDTAREFGLSYQMVRHHRRYCLPWRSVRTPKPVTCEEQLEALKYELARLQVLGEAGESISGALAAVRERRAVLELEMRVGGKLDATHKKLLLNSKAPEGDYEVIFVNGQPKTVKTGSK
jgi:transposase-like protein